MSWASTLVRALPELVREAREVYELFDRRGDLVIKFIQDRRGDIARQRAARDAALRAKHDLPPDVS